MADSRTRARNTHNEIGTSDNARKKALKPNQNKKLSKICTLVGICKGK
jgi:hypothetical protein